MQTGTGKRNKKQMNAVQNVSANIDAKTPQKKIAQRKRAKYECSSQLGEIIEQANLVKDVPKFSLEIALRQSPVTTPLTVIWYDFFFSLPKEVQHFIFLSEEARAYDKRDGYEFWINNDGYALDTLTDLNNDEQIGDELYEKLYNSDFGVIADFLVDYGYFGDEYSYRKQKEKDKKSEFSYETLEYEIDNDQSFTESFFKIEPDIKALERLHAIREFLLSIINLSKAIQSYTSIDDENDFYTRKAKEDFSESAIKEFDNRKLKDRVLATSININEKGEISFSISDWANALQGVDITRIRICEVCGDIFWANRKDAFACSVKHAKVRQMRLLRDNWKKSGRLYVKARNNKQKKEK